MNKFLLKKLAVFIVGCFLLFTASAQQLQPNAINQINSLMQEKELRTPAQKKMDSHLIYGAKMGRGERITSEVVTLEENLNRDARGLVLVDIHGKINDAILQAIKNAGGIIIFSSPRFNVVTARIPLQATERIAGIPEVQTINATFPPRHAGNLVNLSGYKTAGTPLIKSNETNFFSLRPGFAERSDRIRKQVLKALEKENLNTWHLLAGAVTSQGDATHSAAAARTTFGVNGAGIKIGVLSDSYNNKGGAAANVTSGDLPGTTNPNGFTTPVTVLSDYPSGESDEGRAMLQIVHDIAPGAQLYFATAFTSEAAFAQNILNLRAAGCDIICDDVFYYDEPVFYDGVVAQAVNSVTNEGALYFSSAGNQGNKTDNTSSVWEGDFVDGGAAGNPLPSGRLHTFSAGIKYDQLTAAVSPIALFWSDPPGASTNDYDLYVLNSSMSMVVASSTTTQNGSQNPFEYISASLTSGRRIVILKKTGDAVRALHLNTFGGGTSSSLSISTQGQTHGHSSAANAFSCAATPAASSFCGGANYPPGPYPNAYNTSNKVECFSSDGPRRKFYNAAGAAITPGNLLFATGGGTLLQKPDISAADGVATSGFSGTTGLNPFYGTSAAAPHAAAIAALIKQFSPGLTTVQLRNTITSTAIDIEAGGPDRNSGYGIIMAYDAIQPLNANGTLEAENAVLSGAVVASNQPGFTGSGFADYIHASSDFIEWTFNASTPGSFLLQFRYANGGTANRPLQLKVNDVVVNASLAFSPTGSFATWSVSSATANLLAGTNKVRLTAIGSSGPNVDNLKADIVPCQSRTLEAEQAVLSGVVVGSNQPGFTGTGFADYINASGDFIEWTISASSAGSFSLQFRYANGGATNRPLELKVNGSVVTASLAFSPTGSFATWSVSSATANLIAGANKVRLTATGSSGPNVDNLAFSCNNSMQSVQRPLLAENLLPASPDFLSAYVAPNPASGNTTLILSASSHLPVNLQLVDMLGRRHQSLKLIPGGSNTFNLSVNDLLPGSYIVIITQGNLSTHARLIVAGK